VRPEQLEHLFSGRMKRQGRHRHSPFPLAPAARPEPIFSDDSFYRHQQKSGHAPTHREQDTTAASLSARCRICSVYRTICNRF
jgi:hypothetical protein